MDNLFYKVGFIDQYRKEFTEFYAPYFTNEEELNNFFYQVFKNDDTNKIPKRMMNQIQRFVSLANDIDKIRPSKDALQIVFIRTCIESLCKLANPNNKKQEDFDKTSFFSKYLDKDSKQYILDNFIFTGLEPAYKMEEKERFSFDQKEYYDLTIDDFGLILFAIRGMVVHEGDYWSMQFFAKDDEYTWCTQVTTDYKMINDYKPQKGKTVTYHFDTTLQYEKFIECFVKGCITYLQVYIETASQTRE